MSAVVLYHAGVPFLGGGYVGVDVFFVISGFLITRHLLADLQRNGRVSFASFYAKRARRILPASFVVLALSLVAALIWYPPLLMREVWQGALASALYVPNMLFGLQGTNYLAEKTPSLFQHYWSLGVEEQFYLIWPVLLGLGFFALKRPRVLFVLVSVMVIASFIACVVLTFRSQPWAFFSLPTRAWELGIGGLVAFVLAHRPRVLTGMPAALVGWAGVLVLLASVLLFSSDTQFPGFWAAVPVMGTAAVIISGESRAAFGPSSALTVRPMLFIGLISYSLYLVHWPLLQVAQAAVGFENPLPLWTTVLLGLISLPLAWVMYRFVENPGRNFKWLATARPLRTLVAAAAASALVVGAATAMQSLVAGKQLYVERSAPEANLAVPPSFTDYVPENLMPSLREASADQPEVYEDGCHLDYATRKTEGCVYGDESAPRIALFGDSHAAQWFPALLGFAEDNGYAVANYTKSSCPSVAADVLLRGIPYTECSDWRESVYAELDEAPPALVVVANKGGAPLAGPIDDYGGGAWAAALTETLERIDSPVVVIADTPDLQHTPSVCLSANLTSAQSCGQPRHVAVSGVSREAEEAASRRAGVPLIDLTDLLCSENFCAPIIGNTLAYRDEHHLTATFSRLLAEPLGQRLREELCCSGPR